MTRKEPLPLLGTQRPRGLRAWAGLGGAPGGTRRGVSSGLGPRRGRGGRELTEGADRARAAASAVACSCPPPPAGSLALTTTPGVHRAATPLLSHRPIPIPASPGPLQPELGGGAWGAGGGQATRETAAPWPLPTRQPRIPLDAPGTHRPRLQSHPRRSLPSSLDFFPILLVFTLPTLPWVPTAALSSLPDRPLSAPLFPREMR